MEFLGSRLIHHPFLRLQYLIEHSEPEIMMMHATKKMRYHSPFNFLSFRLNDVAEAAHSRFYDYTNID